MTRTEPDGVMVLMMTRWHQNDLAGRILAEAEEADSKWTVIRLPTIAEAPEDLPGWRREPCKAPWPERYPAERLHRIRRRISPYWWAALYQQRPATTPSYRRPPRPSSRWSACSPSRSKPPR